MSDLQPGVVEALQALAAGESVAKAALSPAAIAELEALGVVADGEVFRLAEDVELLCEQEIRCHLGDDAARWLNGLEVRTTIGSTNAALLERAQGGSVHGQVLTAEVQTAGRGRRGRSWLSPFGRNLAFSTGLDPAPRSGAELGTLSLVTGLCVRDGLTDFGLRGVEVKWPNDVLLQGRKVCGILIELVRAAPPAEVRATPSAEIIVGIGINVGCRSTVAGRVEQDIADVADQIEDASRNELLARVLTHLVAGWQQFIREGFAPFIDRWHAAHRYNDAAVAVITPAETVHGIARGIDASGAFLLETGDGVRAFTGGEVSVREDG